MGSEMCIRDSPSEDRYVTLSVSTKGIKTIDRDGIEAVVARLRAQGERI